MTVPGNLSSPLLATAGAAAAGANITKSVRFNKDDGAYLSRTPSSAGNRKTWTWSGWIKLGREQGSSDRYTLFECTENFPASGNPYGLLNIVSGYLGYGEASGGAYTSHSYTAFFRDHSSWYHIVAAMDTTQSTAADRLKMYVNGVQYVLSGYTFTQNADTAINQQNVKHSIGREENSDIFPADLYMTDVYFIDGQQLDCTSFGAFDANGVWQAAAYSGSFGTNGFHLFDFANESTVGHDSSGNNNDFTANNITTGNTFSTNMTPSSTAYPNTTLSNGGLSWSGNVANDTGTVSSLTIPTNKKTYVEVTHTTTGGGNPGPGVAQGPTVELGLDSVKAWWRGGTDGSASSSTLGSFSGTNTSWSNGDVLGIALDNTANSGAGSISFYKNGTQIHTGGSGWTSYTDLRFEFQSNGSNTDSGTWNYGASAFSYPLSGHTGLFEGAGADEDVLRDVPVNGDQSDTGAGGEVSGNYCTLNPLTTTGGNSGTSSAVLSNGNLTTTNPSTAGFNTETGTIVVQSGKWYYEFVAGVSGSNILAGWCDPREVNYNDAVGNTGRSYGYYSTGNVRNSNSNTGFGSSYGAGDVIGCAIDIDNQKIYWSKNGTWQNSADPAAGTGSIYTIQDPVANNFFYTIGVTTYASGQTIDINTGQRAFAYTAPSGFKALCTTNLPTPTIADGSDYFNAITYTGDGVNDRTITTTLTTVGAAWIKRRNATDNHRIGTVVQGGNAFLSPNLTGAENNATSVIRAFSTNTFDLGTDTSVNSSSDTYVAWAWDAGTSNADNTDGSIATTVRANIAAGFSIVTYSGTDTGSSQTLGHGLGVAPKFWIFKNRSVASDWIVYTTAIDGSTDFAKLNTSDPFASGVSPWSTAPTSSVITVGTNNVDTCNAGNNYILYAFTPVEGYSAIGSYAGNGSSTDGPFIHTGFRSRWILIKRTDGGTNNWVLHDTARDQHNEVTKQLLPSTSAAETDTGVTGKDILSNGFKIRGDNDAVNKSGGSYIYIAFAENPFQANGGLAR
tara:strand:+ start:10370 stop:13405 length:3036 start_codon:yes stop_codon:yes gene_type:complete